MAIDLAALTPEQLQKYINVHALNVQKPADSAQIVALRDYYDGKHPVMLTERQQEFLGPLLDPKAPFPFAHNHVKSIIDTLRERLSVTGINIEGVAEDDTTSPEAQVQAAMWKWWTKARLDSEQIRLYRRALRDGKAYVLVDYDAENERPRFSLHHADAGENEPGVFVVRDPTDPNRILFAVLRLFMQDPADPQSESRERRTVYMPDQVRKYIRGRDGQWEPIMDPGDPSWPIMWTDRMGTPLGIVAVEFANPGGSEVEQVIGLQNALNKAWLDLIAAADTSGFPLVVFDYQEDMGQLSAAPDDADHVGSDEIRLSPARVIEVIKTNVQRLEAADMSQMIAVIDRIEQAISGVSRTPSYYLKPVGGSDVPSGEALKQLESGLVRRAEERQLVFGQAWEDVFALAYRIHQAFGPSLPDVPDMTLNVTWQDANVRNELAEAQTAEAHQRLGVPQVELWRKLGYTPEQIEQFQQQALQDKQAQIAALTDTLRKQTGAQAQGGNNGIQQIQQGRAQGQGQGQTQGR